MVLNFYTYRYCQVTKYPPQLRMSEDGSVSSIESLTSAIPASPSALYDLRDRFFQTCERLNRKALTEYNRKKCPSQVEERCRRFHRNQTYRRHKIVLNQEMTFISI